MNRNYAEVIEALAARAADVLAMDGGDPVRVEMMEAADGSRRWLALLSTHTAGLEQEYRINAPAPADAPDWARSRFEEYSVEVRVGEGKWLELDDEPDYDENAWRRVGERMTVVRDGEARKAWTGE